ncbi:MAG: hypothetical protein HY690_20920 [Chloroflexi bacterium]|nr:hypothetical protein [Chloroflexota bacterium]
MAQEETAAGARAESGARERRTITGLADLLPDWVLPPEGKQHVRNARKELLLAVRSVLDRAIEAQEKGGRGRRAPTKIEIE